jgi:hypothetical protein
MRERKDGRGQEADRDRAQVQRASLGLSPLYLYLEVSTTSVPSHMQAAVAPTVRGHACCSKLVRTTHTTLRRASDRWETNQRVSDNGKQSDASTTVGGYSHLSCNLSKLSTVLQ